MPQTEQEGQNQAQQAAPVEPSGPTPDELASTLQNERVRAMQLEAERDQLRQALYTARPPAPGPAGPDPLARFTENVLSGDPAENRRMLEIGINQRLAGATNQVAQNLRREMQATLAMEREQAESQRVLDRLMNSNPELADPKNRSRFAAMLTKAHLDSQEQGLRLSMDQIGERAVREYRSVYGPKGSSTTPFVEGVSSPGLSAPRLGQDPNQPVAKNALEEGYGMKAGEIEPISAEGMKKVTTDYVQSKNSFLRKKAVGNSAIVTLQNELGG